MSLGAGKLQPASSKNHYPNWHQGSICGHHNGLQQQWPIGIHGRQLEPGGFFHSFGMPYIIEREQSKGVLRFEACSFLTVEVIRHVDTLCANSRFASGNPSWWIFCSKDAKAAWVTNGHDLLKSLSFWSLAGLLEKEEAMALLFGKWKQFLEKTWLGLINGN